MYHRVATALVLDTGSGTTALEFTRAIELGEDNCAAYEIWVVSATGTISGLLAYLQGSNDLTNWTSYTSKIELGTGGADVTVPTYASLDIGVISWSFLRIRFECTSSGGSFDCMVRAAINTSKRD